MIVAAVICGHCHAARAGEVLSTSSSQLERYVNRCGQAGERRYRDRAPSSSLKWWWKIALASTPDLAAAR